ncbi:MAG: hypothetical protein K9G49_04030 [Taibaiella sp.]|nr:hypothetical protein [Taibaiella sp.]
MKGIKRWKAADILVQVLSLTLPWVFFYLFPNHKRLFHLDNLLQSYTVVGASQMVSCIANKLRLPLEYKTKSRGWYELVVLIILLMTAIAAAMNSMILALMLLLYLSPVLAVWYLVISATELLGLYNIQYNNQSE